MAKLYGFYKSKTEAMRVIKQMALKEAFPSVIEMYILEEYGLGEKFVFSYLEKLVDNGFITINKDKITSLVKQKVEAEAENEAEDILKKG